MQIMQALTAAKEPARNKRMGKREKKRRMHNWNILLLRIYRTDVFYFAVELSLNWPTNKYWNSSLLNTETANQNIKRDAIDSWSTRFFL